MRGLERDRHAADLAADLHQFGERCERIGGRLAGLTLLFGVVALLVAGAGVWLRAPLFAASAGCALAAAAAFGASAYEFAHVRRALPRVVPAIEPRASRRIEPRRRAA